MPDDKKKSDLRWTSNPNPVTLVIDDEDGGAVVPVPNAIAKNATARRNFLQEVRSRRALANEAMFGGARVGGIPTDAMLAGAGAGVGSAARQIPRAIGAAAKSKSGMEFLRHMAGASGNAAATGLATTGMAADPLPNLLTQGLTWGMQKAAPTLPSRSPFITAMAQGTASTAARVGSSMLPAATRPPSMEGLEFQPQNSPFKIEPTQVAADFLFPWLGNKMQRRLTRGFNEYDKFEQQMREFEIVKDLHQNAVTHDAAIDAAARRAAESVRKTATKMTAGTGKVPGNIHESLSETMGPMRSNLMRFGKQTADLAPFRAKAIEAKQALAVSIAEMQKLKAQFGEESPEVMQAMGVLQAAEQSAMKADMEVRVAENLYGQRQLELENSQLLQRQMGQEDLAADLKAATQRSGADARIKTIQRNAKDYTTPIVDTEQAAVQQSKADILASKSGQISADDARQQAAQIAGQTKTNVAQQRAAQMSQARQSVAETRQAATQAQLEVEKARNAFSAEAPLPPEIEAIPNSRKILSDLVGSKSDTEFTNKLFSNPTAVKLMAKLQPESLPNMRFAWAQRALWRSRGDDGNFDVKRAKEAFFGEDRGNYEVIRELYGKDAAGNLGELLIHLEAGSKKKLSPGTFTAKPPTKPESFFITPEEQRRASHAQTLGGLLLGAGMAGSLAMGDGHASGGSQLYMLSKVAGATGAVIMVSSVSLHRLLDHWMESPGFRNAMRTWMQTGQIPKTATAGTNLFYSLLRENEVASVKDSMAPDEVVIGPQN